MMHATSTRLPRALTRPLLALATSVALAGCAPPEPYDHSALRANMPTSILVLPPRNESIEPLAPYSYLTTVTRPLAEMGYYVYPVAVIDQFMKDNGLPTPDEMHGVSLAKLNEIIGPDAVMYIVIEAFGQKFVLLSSTTVVRVRAQLVDADTAAPLWSGEVQVAEGSGGSGDVLADVVAAAIVQALDTVADQSHDAARRANHQLFANSYDGLLVGPRHPEFGAPAK